MRVNSTFYDNLKDLFTKEIFLPQPAPKPLLGTLPFANNLQNQLPDPKRNVTVYALLYDYQKDQMVDCKRQDFEYADVFKTFIPDLELTPTLKENFNRYLLQTRSVARVEGPFEDAECTTTVTEVTMGTKYYFKATPAQSCSPTELLLINWRYRYDDGEVKAFNFGFEKNNEANNVMSCVFNKTPKNIKIYAFFRELNEKISVSFGVLGTAIEEVDEISKDQNDKENEKCKSTDFELIWGSKVDCEFRKKVIEMGNRLHFEPNDLMAVMAAETNRTFSASVIKLLPKVNDASKKEFRGLTKDELKDYDDNFDGAVGLIQFTNVAITELNRVYKIKLSKKSLALMKPIEQLDYVEKYIALWIKTNKIKNKLTLSDLYVLVFAPAKMGNVEDSTLYEKGTEAYEKNKSLDVNKNDKISKKELTARVQEIFEEGNQPENKNGKSIDKIANSKIVVFDKRLSPERKAVVGEKSILILQEVAKKTNNSTVIITSTIRTTKKQAEIMYQNEESGNSITYTKPGKDVQNIFKIGKKNGLSKDQIIDKMNEKIISLYNEGKKVSLHCVPDEIYKKVNVLDVSISMDNPLDFLAELILEKDVLKIIQPLSNKMNQGKISFDTKERAIHIEIKQ